MRSSSLKIISVILSVISAVLWGIAAAGACGTLPARGVPLDRTAAGTVTVVAALCWLARGLRSQGDEVYARVIGELAEREARSERRHLRPAGSGPLPRA